MDYYGDDDFYLDPLGHLSNLGGEILNLAVRLSLARIVLAFIFMAFLFGQNILSRVLALLIFLLAVITDIYDGRVARSRGLVTSLGILLDPLADKILMAAAFISFVGLKELSIPAWTVVIIITREFIITGLRRLAAGEGIILPAEREGKHKTASQMTAILLILLYLIIQSAGNNYGWWTGAVDIEGRLVINLVMLVTVILTAISGGLYLNRHKKIFLK
jgi:CDP-diacylglycerol--glycerol-3-phosphate 3-phosphatidyltransferase